MCSVPPKFFQVCRLCLMLIEEHDISPHQIYNTTSVPNASNKECKCSINLDNAKCCNRVRKCYSCDKYQNKFELNVPPNSLLPRVPLSANPLITNVHCEDGEDYSDKINKQQDRHNQSMFSNPYTINENLKVPLKNSCYHDDICIDDSSTSIAMQILKCLSLEVFPADGLPALVCCNCKSYLQSFWNFRKMAHKTNNALKEFLKLCNSSEKNSADISTYFNNLLSSNTYNKSSSEQMAAKALTELSTFSKNDSLLKETSKSMLSPLKIQQSFEKILKKEYNNTACFENQNVQSGNNEIGEDLNPDKRHSFQQQLETAAVLMDISKKVIKSPPCSNHQSPKQCLSIDSSILNSVIRDKRPVNDNLDFNEDLAIKDTRCDLRNLIDFYSRQDKSRITNGLFLETSISNDKKLQSKMNTNAFNIIVNNSNIPQSNTPSFSNDKMLNIETEIRCERKTPDSQVSEEHDAATTQLWQALARSAANNSECHETNQLLHILNNSFAYPTTSSLLSVDEKVPEEPIALLKNAEYLMEIEFKTETT